MLQDEQSQMQSIVNTPNRSLLAKFHARDASSGADKKHPTVPHCSVRYPRSPQLARLIEKSVIS